MAKPVNLVDAGELENYDRALNAYLNNEINEEQFTAIRLQQGVYGQRQSGLHMIRIKIPGGKLGAVQFETIATVLQDYSKVNFVNITTRQDIQLHSVPLKYTGLALSALAQGGLTTREACGNTVRNITACSLAGVCPNEHTDVQLLLEDVAAYFLRHPLTQHLPRKFKMSFSGCEVDCAQGLMHDLAVIAVKSPAGRFGFKIMAGGGLGHKPREAFVVEEFAAADRLIAVIEAILTVHHKYSDRTRRARARLKFLIEKTGRDKFLQLYRAELDKILRGDTAVVVHPQWNKTAVKNVSYNSAHRGSIQQKQTNLYTLPIHVPLGDVNAKQLSVVSRFLQLHDGCEARVTLDQNIIFLNLTQEELLDATHYLSTVNLYAPSNGDDVVACPGTWTCRLGITASRDMAKQISDASHLGGLRVRVSGCHNGCAQPSIGDIGLHGEARRIHGKLIPHYQFHFGGEGTQNGAIARKGPEIPVMRAKQAIDRVVSMYNTQQSKGQSFRNWVHAKPADFFTQQFSDLASIEKDEVFDLLTDINEQSEFCVLQLGGGECAGVAQESLAAKLAEIDYERNYRDAFIRGDELHQALQCLNAMLKAAIDALVVQECKTKAEKSAAEKLQDLTAVLQYISNIRSLPVELVEPALFFNSELAKHMKSMDKQAVVKLAAALDAWLVLLVDYFNRQNEHGLISIASPHLINTH